MSESYLPCNAYCLHEQLVGMARPGSRLEVSGEVIEGMDRSDEVQATCDWLEARGFEILLSLSSAEMARDQDPGIKAAFKGRFYHIPCEDGMLLSRGGVPVKCITLDMLNSAVELVLPFLQAGKKVAVYCGAGIGRTPIFVSAILSLFLSCPIEAAIERVKKTMLSSGMIEYGDPVDLNSIEMDMKASNSQEALEEFALFSDSRSATPE